MKIRVTVKSIEELNELLITLRAKYPNLTVSKPYLNRDGIETRYYIDTK